MQRIQVFYYFTKIKTHSYKSFDFASCFRVCLAKYPSNATCGPWEA